MAKTLKAISYRCSFPGCREIIPDYNLYRYSKLINFHGKRILVCKDCGDKFEDEVLKVMQNKLAEDTARETGLTKESILALREESEYWRKEDERLVDDEVDVMDSKRARKLFRKKGDQHEEAKPPLQVMTERFAKGLRKQREKKILVVSGGISIPQSLKKG